MKDVEELENRKNPRQSPRGTKGVKDVEELEPVAYLFDYEEEQGDGSVLVPPELQFTRVDPRTHARWSHVEVVEIHELVKKSEVNTE